MLHLRLHAGVVQLENMKKPLGSAAAALRSTGSSQAEVTFKHDKLPEKLVAVIGVVDMLERKIKAVRLQMADRRTEEVVGHCGHVVDQLSRVQ